MSERSGSGGTRWRRTVEAMLPPDLTRRAVEHDLTHAGGGYLVGERVEGEAGAVLVPDERVTVAIDTLPTVANQEQFNAYILALVGAIGNPETASFGPDYYYVRPYGDDTTAPAWLTRNGRIYRRAT